jgi:predicted deacylase
MKTVPMFVWEDYTASPLLTVLPAQLREKDVTRILKELHALRPDGTRIEEIGKSYEGRPIHSVTMGQGPINIFAWSQMHGNEPTHTAVLIDLIDLLQRHPDHTVAKDILTECTLTLVPMLNPDGAERYIRRNAQDIDINRDALHLATPEGRLLRKMVEQVKPQFAFNLHNQQPGTSVDGFHVAAVSLLVPPIDIPDTQTEWTEQARQVAVTFLNAVRPHCKGMISRYDADFMPRCFGEWVQQQKIATLTVEAGGWSTVDTTPLVQVHFLGMINAFAAIANGCYTTVNPKDYDALPRSSDQYMFDIVVRDAEVVPTGGHEPFKADLGINFTKQQDRVPIERGGRIEDFGDLCVTTGKQVLEYQGLPCVPGRVIYQPNITPSKLPTTDQAQQLFEHGITTVIGSVNLNEPAELDALGKLTANADWPVNVGFVAKLPTNADSKVRDQLLRGIAAGVLGVVGKSSGELQDVLNWFGLPLLDEANLPTDFATQGSLGNLVDDNFKFANELGLTSRSDIRLTNTADLLFFDSGTKMFSPAAIKHVMLGGKLVLNDRNFLSGASGELLLRRRGGVQ